MKKVVVFLILILFSTSCTKEITLKNHTYVNDEDYLTLVNLLENEVLAEDRLEYVLIDDGVTSVLPSYNYFSKYSINLSSYYKSFSHTTNSNSIEVRDAITGETTTFIDNVDITSLNHFSELVLDSFDDFSYYSVADFIPLALELIDDEDLEFIYTVDRYSMNQYEITTTLDKLNLDNDLHNSLLVVSSIYSELYNVSNPKISIYFRTNPENEYLLSSFEFLINSQRII